MFSKILLTTFLGTSFLGNTVFASDRDYQQRPTLTLTTQQLKEGYAATLAGGHLELPDGTKWVVTNTSKNAAPRVDEDGNVQFSYEPYTYSLTASCPWTTYEQDGGFNFTHYNSFANYRWNEETKKMELFGASPLMEIFDLTVKSALEAQKHNDKDKTETVTETLIVSDRE